MTWMITSLYEASVPHPYRVTVGSSLEGVTLNPDTQFARFFTLFRRKKPALEKVCSL